MNQENKSGIRLSPGMMLITLGVVYGDIGTSPMYVMKSIVLGNGGIAGSSEEFIVGALSLVVWTITLLTTIKYVCIAMKADNENEGGILALYYIVRRYGKWLAIPAIIGGAAILADGALTPAVTVTTAIEGLRSIELFDRVLGRGQGVILIITLVIILILFTVQHSGTSRIGRAFGPVMLIWFLFLGASGLLHIADAPTVLRALNPVWAVRVLLSDQNRRGFMILGSVFLATTGAEALYADMGHVGKSNIYATWPLVKICLILNYFGQGAWIIRNLGNPVLARIPDMNPFFMMLPESIRPFAVVLGAMAAVIASQALISGSYTIVSEAINLDFMPHMHILYPSETKGQLYIPIVNNILCVTCCLVVIMFRTGERMEAAYGLAITVTMMMTTLLLWVYIAKVKKHLAAAFLVLIVFEAIESVFFVSSLSKFARGGWFTVLIASLLTWIMFVWYRGTKIEARQRATLRMRDYIDDIDALRSDESIPRCSDNIVFLTNEQDPEIVDRDILYSILDKDPKRAETYWLLNIRSSSQPSQAAYSIENYGTDFIFFVRFDLGFKVDQRINGYLRQVVSDLMASGELPKQEREHSIYGPSDVGNFKFCMLHKVLSSESALSTFNSLVMATKYTLRHLIGSPANWYGLESSSLMV